MPASCTTTCLRKRHVCEEGNLGSTKTKRRLQVSLLINSGCSAVASGTASTSKARCMTRNIVSLRVALLATKSGCSLEKPKKKFKAKKELSAIQSLHRLVVKTNWVWPKVRRPFQPRTVLTDLVTEKRVDLKHNALRGDASEILLLYPILRFFAETCCKNIDIEREIASLLLLCAILDCKDIIKKGFGTEASATTLQEIMKKHLTAFVACYGLECVIPKTIIACIFPSSGWNA